MRRARLLQAIKWARLRRAEQCPMFGLEVRFAIWGKKALELSAALKRVQGANHAAPAAIEYVRINHRRGNVRVAE